jgi:uncharacterized protein with ParB-like and HNH nuclease domain
MENSEEKKDKIFEKIESEDIDKEIDIAPYKIITYGADYTLSVLNEKLGRMDIIVPMFQRKYVWPPIKASKLIESFLLSLPVPQIFLYKEAETEKLLVVDGYQRLKTIECFYNEQFPDGKEFRLSSVKPKWEGKKYTELSEPDRIRLDDSVLRATIFQQTDPKDNSSVFEVFERLNTGGMTLKEQEIRNCIIQGHINGFLEDLNQHPSWRKLFGRKPDARMRDIELILRFLALYSKLASYSKPMKWFLTQFMMSQQNLSAEEQKKYSDVFKNTMDFILDNFGSNAFRIKFGINVALFDAISISLARLDKNKLSDLENKRRLLIEDPHFRDLTSLHTTDKEAIIERISIAAKVFSK